MTQISTKRDAEIQQDVLRELRWDTRVEETEVGVEVDSGVVTLTGTVSSWAKRLAAQDAAHRVIGVLDVANDIQVKWPGTAGRTDTELAHAVRGALEWDVFVPHQRIRTTVSEGEVTLEGEVDQLRQREDAAGAVRNLEGVRRVTNRITVKPSHQPAATEVRKAIEEALERQVAREARRIHVDIRDGRVTVSGTVRSWAEREAVLGAARGTPGVASVANKLTIERST